MYMPLDIKCNSICPWCEVQGVSHAHRWRTITFDAGDFGVWAANTLDVIGDTCNKTATVNSSKYDVDLVRVRRDGEGIVGVR